MNLLASLDLEGFINEALWRVQCVILAIGDIIAPSRR